MSRSDDTTADARAQLGKRNRDILNMIQRVGIAVTSGPFWQAIGGLLLDGATRATANAEAFTGIGFYSRPAPGVNAEAIMLHVAGAAELPVIVATRDEDTRKRVAKLKQDETMAYNTQAGVLINKDGKIFACSHGGTPVELAKVSELNDLRAAFAAQFTGAGHVHATPGGLGGPTTSTIPVGSVPTTDYLGTDVLKGQ